RARDRALRPVAVDATPVDVDALLDVAEGLDPERVGEAARRVDREDEHLAAEPRRSGNRRRCRHRGLPDAAGSAEHHDLARREQRFEPWYAGHESSCPSWWATMRVTRSPWSRTNRYGSRSNGRSTAARNA